MDNRSLFELINHMEEGLRIGNLKSIYKYILDLGATVQSVEDMGNNKYRITLSSKVFDKPCFTTYLVPTGEYDKGVYEVMKSMEKC